MRTSTRLYGHLLAAAVALVQAGVAHAQEVPPGEPKSGAPQKAELQSPPESTSTDALLFEEIVVTASTKPLSKLKSSVSVSTLDPEQMQQSAPGSAADILRNVPGLRAEASGGEGNANISARGLISGGGAKFTQFQEDGLPVLDFGDIDFGTADTFLRADYNIARLEVVRGGSASTFASNAPAGVFNFISKTGTHAGGALGITKGVNFADTRYDFDYGRPIDDHWKFHLGGFLRSGDGPRTVGYTAESGGQLKANVTYVFDNGFIRFNVKLLDDNAPVYLPVPISISGSLSNPRVESFPGFDVRHGAPQSPQMLRDLSVTQSGATVVTDLTDGYYSQSRVLGGEASFTLPGDWKLDDKLRVAAMSGRFVGRYPAEVNSASALATEIGGAGARLKFATGPSAGRAIADPDALNGNGLAVRVHLFNATLRDLGGFTNDLNVTKALESASLGTLNVTAGYYQSRQNIVQDWHWNTYLEEVKGQDAALLDVVDAGGALVTQSGLVAYGEPYGGNCCVRSYQLHYDTYAPYLSAGWELGRLNVDASVRYDISHGSGTYAGATGTTSFDVNGDGTIEPPERSVPIVNNSVASPVDYTQGYLSASLGANVELASNLAVFARGSRGGRANAERLLFGGGINADGSVARQAAINFVYQVEGGAKWRADRFGIFATLFYSNMEERNQDITSATQRFISRVYESEGLELEGALHLGRFNLTGGATLIHSRITKDEIRPADLGHTPGRQAALVYQVTPSFSVSRLKMSLNLIGTTRSYADETNTLVMPAYLSVNAFAGVALADGLWLSASASNLLDAIGLTEVQVHDNALGPATTGLHTARSINGRAIMSTLKYSF